MLHRAKELKGYPLQAKDGEIGKVKEFYFDDQNWVIRYLVVDTGGWLTGRRVLISPYALTGEIREAIPVNLTKKQIENSPSPESDLTVSRQFERKYYTYYNWPLYWQGPYVWGAAPLPYFGPMESGEPARPTAPGEEREEGDAHLRSTKVVSDYRLQARDGEIGHVDDFVIDDSNWSIRYLLINTSNWWQGRYILMPPTWASSISWHESKVFVDVDRQTIKGAPEFHGNEFLTRRYEEELHRYYNRQGYWADEHHHEMAGRR